MAENLLPLESSTAITVELQITDFVRPSDTTVHLPYNPRLQQLGIHPDELQLITDNLSDALVLNCGGGSGCRWFACFLSGTASVRELVRAEVNTHMVRAVGRWNDRGIDAEFRPESDQWKYNERIGTNPATLVFNGSKQPTYHSPWGSAPSNAAPVPSAPYIEDSYLVQYMPPPAHAPVTPSAAPSAPPLSDYSTSFISREPHAADFQL